MACRGVSRLRRPLPAVPGVNPTAHDISKVPAFSAARVSARNIRSADENGVRWSLKKQVEAVGSLAFVGAEEVDAEECVAAGPARGWHALSAVEDGGGRRHLADGERRGR